MPFFLCFLVCTLSALGEILRSPVVDDASVWTEIDRTTIVRKLETLRSEKDRWLVIHTTPSLKGETIEEYAERKFKSWQIGEAGKDNGLLLVLAMNDRKMRLEVGYGLEGEIPDIKAKQILEEILAPSLKDGHPLDGALNVIDAIREAKDEVEAKEAQEKANLRFWEDRKKIINQRFDYPPGAITDPMELQVLYLTFDYFEENGILLKITSSGSDLSSLPTDGKQRVHVSISGKEIQITRDPVGFFTGADATRAEERFREWGYEGLREVLWDVKMRLQEEESRKRMEVLSTLPKPSPWPREFALAVWLLFPAGVFLFIRKTAKRFFAVTDTKLAELNLPEIKHDVTKLFDEGKLFFSLIPALAVLLAGATLIFSREHTPISTWEFSPLDLVEIVFGMTILSGFAGFISFIASAVGTTVYVGVQLTKLAAKRPEYATVINKIFEEFKMKSSGSGSGGSSSSYRSSSSSSSRSSSSFSSGGRSGGGGSSSSW